MQRGLLKCSARITAVNLEKGRRVPAGPLISIIDDDESMRKAIDVGRSRRSPTPFAAAGIPIMKTHQLVLAAMLVSAGVASIGTATAEQERDT